MSNNDSLGQIVMKLIFYDFKVATLMTTFTFYESLVDKRPCIFGVRGSQGIAICNPDGGTPNFE